MALPAISLTGNLTQDIEVFTTKNGKTGAKINVACNDRKLVNGDWVDGDALFISGVVWGNTAENAVVTLSKGDSVTITGKLMQRSYMTKDNTERVVYEIQIDSLSAGLSRTSFIKNGIKKVNLAQPDSNDPWSAPLSDNAYGVGF